MDIDRWQQIETLYHAALQRAPEARAEWLAQACATDTTLQHEVEKLLAMNDAADGFLSTPAMQIEGAFPTMETQIGNYQILGQLGAGGMGVVYRARDTRLNRDVAIKVLPADFAQNADRLRRFELEAKATGSLNHPNILTIFDIGTHEGTLYLVAELLEGEELRAQLNNGALPMKRAIDYAQQIVAGLTAAHAKNIVHRDLKPENLFVTTDGRVKILDFGLAKIEPPNNVSAGSDVATLKQLTTPGTVMGTVAYMSPEQVRGEAVDARSDLFSFGLILYEMLAGKRAFEGASIPDLMSAILREEPPELSGINHQLEKTMLRCLEKQPERRFQTASDLGFALQSLATPSSAQSVASNPSEKMSWFKNARWAWLVAAVCLFGLLSALAWMRGRSAPANELPMLKTSLLPPEKTNFDFLALSPDGKWLAFTGVTNGRVQLWLRALDSTEAKPLAGTDSATLPFWSPDSRFVAFFVGGKLKKIEATGGLPLAVCDTGGVPTGGSWNRNGVIIFSIRGVIDLWQVAATGGTPTEVNFPQAKAGGVNHPFFLPDGQHFLYYGGSANPAFSGIWLASLDGKLNERILGDNSNISFVASPNGATGHLLFGRDGALMAQPFDAAQRRLSGEAFLVAERMSEAPFTTTNVQHWKFTASDTGLLAFDSHAGRQVAQLVWAERDGTKSPPLENLGNALMPRLSPDGKRFAYHRAEKNTDIWLADVTGANATRFTFDPTTDQAPVWSPDGGRLVWVANPLGNYQLYQKAANGTGEAELLFKSEYTKFATDWSRDGRWLVFRDIRQETRFDILYLDLSQDAATRKPITYLQTPANESVAVLSPDIRWMAYASDESGQHEIYVQSFPQPGSKRQISTAGGYAPRWRGDGKELFYHALDGKLIAVPVNAGDTFETGTPKELFTFRRNNTFSNHYYDVTRDGQRFLLSTVVDPPMPLPLTMVVNWKARAKKE